MLYGDSNVMVSGTLNICVCTVEVLSPCPCRLEEAMGNRSFLLRYDTKLTLCTIKRTNSEEEQLERKAV